MTNKTHLTDEELQQGFNKTFEKLDTLLEQMKDNKEIPLEEAIEQVANRYTGIELDKHYCEISEKRIQAYTKSSLDPNLFETIEDDEVK